MLGSRESLIKDIITCLKTMNRDEQITAIANFSDSTINDIWDTEDGTLINFVATEWYRRMVIKLEETFEKSFKMRLELERTLNEKEYEIERLKRQIKDMEIQGKMLAEPEFFMPTEEELTLARDEGKIDAVKAYRTRTGCGLKTSKESVERAMEMRGWAFRSYQHGT